MSRFAAKGNVEMIRMLGVEFGGNTNISDLQVFSHNQSLKLDYILKSKPIEIKRLK